MQGYTFFASISKFRPKFLIFVGGFCLLFWFSLGRRATNERIPKENKRKI